MIEELPTYLRVSGLGAVVGFCFGLISWKTQFCVAGSIFSHVFAGDSRGIRAVLLACALAAVFSQALQAFDIIDLDASIYRSSTLHLVGLVGGGFLFGFGMMKATGCGAGTLVRLGGGDLRALVVLASMAFFGYMTLRGLTGIPRDWLEQNLGIDLAEYGIATQGLDHLLSAATGLAENILRLVLTGVLLLAALYVCLTDGGFRTSARHWAGATGIALCIAAGWAVTGYLGRDPFDPIPVASLSFVSPVANAAQYFMTFTGATVDFGVATVLGVVFGSLVAAFSAKEFHWQFIDGDKDMIGAMVGGAMMGVGGVAAFGCSIGNGLSGLSTLSLGSLIAAAAILIGGYLGAKRVYD